MGYTIDKLVRFETGKQGHRKDTKMDKHIIIIKSSIEHEYAQNKHGIYVRKVVTKKLSKKQLMSLRVKKGFTNLRRRSSKKVFEHMFVLLLSFVAVYFFLHIDLLIGMANVALLCWDIAKSFAE